MVGAKNRKEFFHALLLAIILTIILQYAHEDDKNNDNMLSRSTFCADTTNFKE
jgi:hypothetical protein